MAVRGHLIQIISPRPQDGMIGSSILYLEGVMPIESVSFLLLVLGSLCVFAGALAYAGWVTANRFSSYELHGTPPKPRRASEVRHAK